MAPSPIDTPIDGRLTPKSRVSGIRLTFKTVVMVGVGKETFKPRLSGETLTVLVVVVVGAGRLVLSTSSLAFTVKLVALAV